MTTMMRSVHLFLVLLVTSIAAFPPQSMPQRQTFLQLSSNQDDATPKKGFWRSFDDALDDFFYKRMGNGEIFYGKRKANPSGKVDGEYNGFGMTDKLRIDQTRELKELWLEEKSRKGEGERRSK